MISVIIPTQDSAHLLRRALPPLVDGVAHGLVRQVILADGGSVDDTRAIADAAGCDIVSALGDRVARMRDGAAYAKGAWLLFLPPETVLAPGWAGEVERFMAHPNAAQRAAVFKLSLDNDAGGASLAWTRFRSRWLKRPSIEQGLLLSRTLYDQIGVYGDDIARRIGGRRLFELNAEVVVQRDAVRESSGV